MLEKSKETCSFSVFAARWLLLGSSILLCAAALHVGVRFNRVGNVILRSPLCRCDFNMRLHMFVLCLGKCSVCLITEREEIG
jgi:hypothetical protein